MQSLQAVEKAWQGTGLFSSRVYPGLSHAGILRDEQFLQDMLGLIGWGQRPRQGSGDARNSGNGLVKFLPGDTAVARELLLPGVESNNTDVASL